MLSTQFYGKKKRARSASRSSNKTQLAIEALEDRLTPATFKFLDIQPPNPSMDAIEGVSLPVTVQLDGNHHCSVDLIVEAAGSGPGFATPGEDFEAFTRRITIENNGGAEQNTITVPIVIGSDNLVEGTEVFRVRLANPGPADGAPGQPCQIAEAFGSFIVRIQDVVAPDNAPPAITVPPPAFINEGGTYTAEASFTDADEHQSWTIDIDYGDGSPVVSYTVTQPGTIPLQHTYGQDSRDTDEGYVPGTITVTDDLGGVTTETFQIYVANVPPQFDAGPDETVAPGTQVVRSGTFTDVAADAPWYGTYAIIGPNGSVVAADDLAVDSQAMTWSLSYTFQQEGDYTVHVSLSDQLGSETPGPRTSVDTFVVHVVRDNNPNEPPVLEVFTGNGVINEGQTFAGSFSFADTTAGPWTAVVDFGDGSPLLFDGVAPGAEYGFSRLFPQDSSDRPDGVFTGTVTVTDALGLQATAPFQVLVRNVAPVVDAGPDITIARGQSVTRAGSFTDPGADQEFWRGTFTVKRNGQAVGSGDISVDSGAKTFTLTTPVLNTAGEYVVEVKVLDDDSFGVDPFIITVRDNDRPEICIDAEDGVIFEGQTFAGGFYFTDSFGGPWTATVSFGEGAPVVLANVQPGTTYDITHLYPQDSSDKQGGVFRGTVTVTDSLGKSATAQFNVKVKNVAPVVNAGPDVTIDPGQSVTRTGTFTDPGADQAFWAGPYTITRNGQVVGSGQLSVDAQNKTFTLTTGALTVPGDYVVKVVVCDDDSFGQDSFVIKVRQNDTPVVGVEAEDGVIYEGDTFAGMFRFTDTVGGPWTATVNFGEGSPVTISDIQPGTWYDISRLYRQDSSDRQGGVFRGTVTVTDSLGRSGAANFDVTVLNVAPVVDAGPDVSINPGQSVSRAGSFTDPGADQEFWAGPYTISYQGIVVRSGELEVNAGDKTFSLDTGTLYLPGDYVVRVVVCDDDSFGEDSFVIHVNAPPLVVPVSGAIKEGQTFFGGFGFQDADHGPWTATVTFGGGETVVLPSVQPGTFYSLSQFYPQDSSDQPLNRFIGTVTVTDAMGLSTTKPFFVRVDNVPPDVDAGPDVVVNVGQSVSRDGSFTDPGADAPWGGGFLVTRGLQVVGGGQLAVNSSDKTFSLVTPVFTEPGIYVVTAKVTDDDSFGLDSFIVKVVAPPPDVEPPVRGLILEGSTFVGAGSFADLDVSGPWVVSVDYGDGSAPVTFTQTTAGPIPLSHLYPQDSSDQSGGVYTGSITVTNRFGKAETVALEVEVLNVAPVVDAGPDVSINPGQSVARTGSFTDPGADQEFWAGPYTISFGGQMVATGQLAVDAQNKTFSLDTGALYLPGDYLVRVVVCDDDSFGEDSFVIHVNAPPVVSATGGDIYEGSTFTGGFSFADPDGGPWTAVIDFGTGSPVTLTGIQPGHIDMSRFFEQDSSDRPGGVFSGTVTVTDSSGLTGTAPFEVLVRNVPPVVDAGPDVTIPAGHRLSITRSGSFTDPGADSPWTGTYTVSQGGVVLETGVLSIDSLTKTFTLTTPVLNNPGDYEVSVVVNDDDSSGIDSFLVHVVNYPPVPVAPPLGEINEGDTYFDLARFTDYLGVGPWTVTITYGDGTAPVTYVAGQQGQIPLSHRYVQDSSDQPGGVYTGRITVVDEFGLVGTTDFKVLVHNVPPLPVAGGNVTLKPGETVSRDVFFTDPGADQPWKVTINYGDGNVVTFQTTDKEFPLSHRYQVPGTYTVVVTVMDDDSQGVATFQVTVKETPVFIPPPWFFNPPPQPVPFAPPPVGGPTRFVPYWEPWVLQPCAQRFPYYLYGGSDLWHPPEVYFDWADAEKRVVVIDEGDVMIQDGHIYDPDPGDSHMGLVNYGDGTGWYALPLRPDKTFTLEHLYIQDGEYEVYVKAIDSRGLVGWNVLRVIVRNVAPKVSVTGVRTVAEGEEFKADGEFKDPGADTWTATVDYGDGSPAKPLALSGKSFKLSHTYVKKGLYRVKVVVNDGREDGVAVFDVEVTPAKAGPAPAPAPVPPPGSGDVSWLDEAALEALEASCEPIAVDGNADYLFTALGSLALAGLLVPLHATGTAGSKKSREQEEADSPDALDRFFEQYGK